MDKELILKQKEVILEELNVKELIIISEDDGIVEITVKVNPKLLGPKYPKHIQQIIKATKTGDYEILEDGNIKVLDFILEDEEAEIIYQGAPGQEVQCDRGVVVAFDTEVTKDLKLEGIARELVRHIQELRKKADFNVDQRIKIQVTAEGETMEALEKFKEYICQETLTDEVRELASAEMEETVNINKEKVTITITKS